MKRARLPLSIALALTSGIALAQEANDPMAQLRACSLMERTERLECLDKLSRAVAPSAPAAATAFSAAARRMLARAWSGDTRAAVRPGTSRASRS